MREKDSDDPSGFTEGFYCVRDRYLFQDDAYPGDFVPDVFARINALLNNTNKTLQIFLGRNISIHQKRTRPQFDYHILSWRIIIFFRKHVDLACRRRGDRKAPFARIVRRPRKAERKVLKVS